MVLWRRWLDRTSPLPWSPRAPVRNYALLPQDRQRLLDRAQGHLAHCSVCQKAASRLGVLRTAVAAAAVATVFFAVPVLDAVIPAVSAWVKRGVGFVVAAALGAAWWGIGQLLSRLHVGPYPPTRNRT